LAEELVEMGEIVKAVSLRGEVKVLLTGDFLEAVLRSRFLRRWRVEGPSVSAVARTYRFQGACLVISLEGCDDRSAAEAMVGERLGFSSDDYDAPGFPRPRSPAPFVYHGLRVETVAGDAVGEVVEVMVLPANLVLRVERGDEDVLIPVIEPVVRELDRAGGRLVIDPIPGLLDGDAEIAG
jgi:16S rRNA processing protein RimM